ncbi:MULTISPECIES: hypothetical protein [unclassified Pseudomonas]|uniref:hypothetical protein n=1 Tax=unclassified Pseudomonas TaxID=196821 RepID=UPI0025EEBC25|nr:MULTISPECIES: hypothetical protein [unclassified Pseudomonas]
MIAYVWDEAGIYVLNQEVDEGGPFPLRSTPTKPPKLTGTQVAHWTGSGWEKLASAPVPNAVQEPVDAVIARYESAVQTVLDAAARQRGYDNLFTAISYADEPAVPRFQADGQAFRRWRSLVWDYAHTDLNAVLAGEKPQPDLDAFLSGLPALELPT